MKTFTFFMFIIPTKKLLLPNIVFMAGIYIHIPYCKKACHYCNFHFSTNLQSKNEFLQALLHEIVLQKNYLLEEPIETLYFGGGTPSILDKDELKTIINTLKSNFKIANQIECTLEANPDDITADKIKAWKEIGINRLSIGIQSFHEEDLKYMNRSHTVHQAKKCVHLAQQNGIDNISIDLIFGFPLLNHEKWQTNIDLAFSLDVKHVSCYAMTVEPKTALASFIATKKEMPIDAEQSATQFEYLMQRMQVEGFEHYEISNYAKQGFRAKHNTNYWKGISYLGLGPSAHSFNGTTRQWNIGNNALYIKSILDNKLPFEIEILSTEQQFNEYIMVSLRLSDGINLNEAKLKYPKEDFETWYKLVQAFEKNGMIYLLENQIRLTQQGKLFADDIASDLFV